MKVLNSRWFQGQQGQSIGFVAGEGGYGEGEKKVTYWRCFCGVGEGLDEEI